MRVRTSQWETAWALLEDADVPALPAGRALRVTGADADRVGAILADLDAEVTEVPATLEEVFLAVTA